MYTDHDNHPRISYDDLGSDAGEPAVLCLPGWCGDRNVFTPLIDTLASRRRSLAMDWRGHGLSAGDEGDFGQRELLADAMNVIEQAALEQVVPVALSHAGWVAIELRRQLGPSRIPAIVLVDWMVLGPPPGFTDALAGLQDPAAWEQVRGALFGMWTTGVESPAVLDYVTSMGQYGFEHWSRAGREIAAAFTREVSPLVALGELAECGQPCPTLHGYAQPSDDGFLDAQRALANEHDWFAVTRFDARSHFPMLETPEAAAATIERFIQERAGAPAAASA